MTEIARMRLQQSLAVLLAAVAMAGHADGAKEHTSDSCDHAATEQVKESSIASIPDYAGSADSEDASDPRTEAATSALQAYHRSITEALSHSSNARDWALATLVHRFEGVLHAGGGDDGDSLLGRSLAAAPNDPLVLWIAIERSNSLGRSQWRDLALQRLREQEPANAAVWLEDVIDGQKSNNAEAVGSALTRMAGSDTFDGHFADLLRAVFDVYQRFPPSVDLAATFSESEREMPAEAIAMTSAMAITAAVAIPGFQHLVNACRVNDATGRNLDRSADCASVGRMLAAHGDTLIASRIGLAVLRVSKTYTDDDVRAARVDDWVYDQYLSMLPTEESTGSLEQFATFHADWIETRSELAAMRRAAIRAGVAATPPDDWIDKKSMFTGERLRADQQAAAEQAATAE